MPMYKLGVPIMLTIFTMFTIVISEWKLTRKL